MKKQSIIATILAAALVVPAMSASAESISELQQEKLNLEKKKESLSKDIQSKKVKIEKAQEAIEKSAKEVSKLNVKIEATNTKIKSVEEKIEETIDEIEDLQASIEKLQKQIEERGELLNERARAMQETGGQVGYLDVLLGSSSFSDFIDRASAVNQIVNADEGIIEDQKKDKAEVKKQQDEMKEKLEAQEDRKAELVELKLDLKSKKANKVAMLKKMEKEQAKLNRQRKKLEGDYSEAVSVGAKVQRKIEVEQKKAIEKAKKLAEAKAKAAAKAAKAAQTAQNSGAVAGSSEVSGEVPKVTAGTWMTPTSGRLTSGYAGRDIGAGNEYHYGIDIANSAGTPIVASADGVVFKAGPLSTYGNVVMITHNIDGQTYTTVYAHMSKFATSSGKSVKKGEVIGYIGSTGRSTGPHLHFEIHKGAWVNQATGAMNPLQFISI